MTTLFNVEHLYRYIQRRGDGFIIKKGKKAFGTYKTLENAMLERDILECCNWNEEIMISLPTVVYNYYFDWDLPPFPTNKKNTYNLDSYITPTGYGHFKVQKFVKGHLVYFGSFRTYKEAKKEASKLAGNGWSRDYDGKRQVKLPKQNNHSGGV